MAKQTHPAWNSWLGTAPPDTSLKNLDRWLKPSLWRGVGWTEDQLWGEARTKGSLYYKVCIDRKAKAFSCTCVARQKPCIHVAALVFNHTEGLWRDEEPSIPPGWLDRRLGSTPPPQSTHPDRPGSKKDLLQLPPGRLEELGKGFEYLSQWLEDQTSLGWRSVLEPGSTKSAEAAARLVDHRMPGPARLIHRLGEHAEADRGPAGVTRLAADLYLACRVFEEGERSPLWPCLMLFCGMTIRKDSLKKQSPQTIDHWIILSVLESEEEGLRMRNTWAWGTSTGRFALLLDFAWGKATLPPCPAMGTTWSGGMHFYPGTGNFRAVMGESQAHTAPPVALPDTWIKAMALLTHYRNQDPWRIQQPVLLDGLFMVERQGKWSARDKENRQMELRLSQSATEELRFIAPSGLMSVFGLQADGLFWPLSVAMEGQWVTLPAGPVS